MTPDEVRLERFRRLVLARLGLLLEGPQAFVAAASLERRAAALSLPVDEYLRRLEADPAAQDDEATELARELTVGETYFFRNLEQFNALQAFVAARAPDPQRPLRVLSAACSSGEEAYSIAMTLNDAVPPGQPWSVLAVDANPAVLARAREAHYTPWSLRDVPPALRQRWFRIDGAEVTIDPAIRDAVRFERRNLIVDDPELWPPESYDVVFCRNVLMYFPRPVAQAVVSRIASALKPGGLLFMGHAENLRGLSSEFTSRHEHGTFYWQRLAAHESPPAPAWTPAAEPARWADAIERASQRVHALSVPPAEVPARPAASPSPLDEALSLVARERYDEALRFVLALPEASAGDPDLRLLRAVLLTHAGTFDEAARVCAGLGADAGAGAAAHADAQHVLALCREGQGDAAGAAACDRRAVALDPDFAMPCLHLAMLARRTGEGAEMRRRFAQAGRLLGAETERRLLLFGGGFGRETLLGLCRAEQGDGHPA